MESIDYWRLAAELSVIQAACLIVGVDPGSEIGSHCEGWAPHEQPPGYVAVRSGLVFAILSGELPAKVRRLAWERGWDEEPAEGEALGRVASVVFEHSIDPNEADRKGQAIARRGVIYRADPDWSLTTIRVSDLKAWLQERGSRPEFFFPAAPQGPEYLDPKHPRYAPKLAAAVRAWEAVTDAGKKSPRQALERWLNEHAAEFGMTDDDGKPMPTPIEECSKVANWQLGGGSPSAGGKNLPTP